MCFYFRKNISHFVEDDDFLWEICNAFIHQASGAELLGDVADEEKHLVQD